MTVTLITGGNKGLGFETARRLIAYGHVVYIGARSVERGKESADKLGAKFVRLDVTDQASIHEAVAEMKQNEGHLDVLINNAGITRGLQGTLDVVADDFRTVYDTNVFGIVRVTQAFLPLLHKSTSPVIVNVSSGLGSFAQVTNPEKIESRVNDLIYSSSKAAVTMLTVQYAKALPEIRINAADPGPTATDLNGHRGYQTVSEGTDVIVKLATLDGNGPTGTFMDRNGIVPW
ncbi:MULTISPECIES: SDR family NAD(P)-dependent oxidoreductase [Paenibacillus]|uniref:SDR family NAD(P)-dependent oxidoreductase n=1 Tax=Paenibacillus TaxID=44249 RepID=UPI00073E4498|nr:MULTISPECIES: SDR family NAD(P)-dependent oxidoreductase [Paenibacillus]MDU4696487.1 SDR family NAD(P)-dependent oxidoreductase [Paenibacillus sp.]